MRIKLKTGTFRIDLTGQRGARLVKLSIEDTSIEISRAEAKRIAHLILAETERHAPPSN